MDELSFAERPKDAPSGVCPKPKRPITVVGWAMVAYILISQTLATLVFAYLSAHAPQVTDNSWTLLTVNAAVQYVLAFPVFWLIVRRTAPFAAADGDRGRMSASKLVRTFIMCMAAMYISNIATVLVVFLIVLLATGGGDVTAINPILDVVANSSPLAAFLYVGLLAPVMEELIFRKMVLGRLRCYGDRSAVVLSAAAFALFHCNLMQIPYAFALGLLFAYVMVRTEKLVYSIVLHMTINVMGGVLFPAVLAGENMALVALVGLFVIAAVALGIAQFVKNRRAMTVPDTPAEGYTRLSAARALSSPGVAVFVLLTVGLTCATLISML